MHETRLLLSRNVREALRNPVIAFLFPIAFPLLGIVLISQGLEAVADLNGFPIRPYVSYLAPSMALLAAMMGCGFSATSLLLDAETGFLDRLKLTSTRPYSLLLSRIAFDALRVLPGAAVTLVAARLLGAHVAFGPVNLVLVLLFVAAWSVAYGGLFYVVALTTRNTQAPLAMAPLFIPVMFGSAAAVPAQYLPGWLKEVSRLNPYSYVLEAARSVMSGGLAAASLLRGALAVLAVAALVLPMVWRRYSTLIRT